MSSAVAYALIPGRNPLKTPVLGDTFAVDTDNGRQVLRVVSADDEFIRITSGKKTTTLDAPSWRRVVEEHGSSIEVVTTAAASSADAERIAASAPQGEAKPEPTPPPQLMTAGEHEYLLRKVGPQRAAWAFYRTWLVRHRFFNPSDDRGDLELLPRFQAHMERRAVRPECRHLV